MMIDEILRFNAEFVAAGGYEPFRTSKFPDKKIAILTCMDTRLTLLLPAALGLKNGDVKMIKNAGGIVCGPYDSAMRSLLVGVYELGVEEIMVIAHNDCGACHLSGKEMTHFMIERGVSPEAIAAAKSDGVNPEEWLEGFHDTRQAVCASVAAIVGHPLMPRDISVRGFIIDSVTGALTEITGGS